MLNSEDKLLRADACHFLTLIGGEGIRSLMQSCQRDADAEIREMAGEWLAENHAG